MIVRVFILVAMLLSAAGCSSDWPQAVPLESSLSRAVAVPMSIDYDVPVVEVMINGSGPFRFMVDTGSAAVVLPMRLADRVKLPESSRGSGLVRTASGTTTVQYRKIESLNLGGAMFRGLDATIVGNSQFSGDRWRDVDGIIGLRVFYHMLLTLDYPGKALRLDPDGALLPEQPGTIPAELIGGQQLMIPVTIGGETQPFLIDTGASHGVVLTEPRLLAQTPVSAGKAATPTGEVDIQLSRLSVDMTIGSHVVRQPVVAIMPQGMYMYSLDPFAAAQEGHSPILGGEVLRHFVVSIDQRSQLVRLTRASNQPIDMPPVRDVWLGVDTRWDSDAIVVTGMGQPPQNYAQSRARELMGLRVGDRIIAIGDVPIRDLSRQRRRELLADGNAVPLTISRNGATFQRLAPIVDIVGKPVD